MLKRVRKLPISLAAKFQLLFGAAVVLIIAAALAVPRHRMEQLTSQLNERSARTLVDYAIAEHEASPAGQQTQAKRPTRATTQAVMVLPPTTQPLDAGEDSFNPPRLI